MTTSPRLAGDELARTDTEKMLANLRKRKHECAKCHSISAKINRYTHDGRTFNLQCATCGYYSDIYVIL